MAIFVLCLLGFLGVWTIGSFIYLIYTIGRGYDSMHAIEDILLLPVMLICFLFMDD